MNDVNLRDCITCSNSDESSMQVLTCISSEAEHIKCFLSKGRQAAETCRGYEEKFSDKSNILIDNAYALAYMLAGKAEFTLMSGKTGSQI